VGLDPATDRLLLLAPAQAFESAFSVRRKVLRAHPSMSFRTDMADARCYLFAHWVLALLQKREDVESVKHDLVPLLVRSQFGLSKRDEEQGTFPPEANLTGSSLLSSMTSRPSAEELGPPGALALRCYCKVIDRQQCGVTRVKDVEAFVNLNQLLLRGGEGRTAVTDRELAKSDAIIRQANEEYPKLFASRERMCAEGFVLKIDDERDPKAHKCLIKRSVLGAGVQLGTGVTIDNCIVLDGVVIGSDCVIRNTVLCAESRVGDGCKLDTCQVEAKYKIAAGTDTKQSFSKDEARIFSRSTAV